MNGGGSSRSRSGIVWIVRRFGVTSSPTRAVAARSAAHERAVVVVERDRQAVDLQLADVVDRHAPASLRTRSSNARSSSASKALAKLSIGRACRYGAKRSDGVRADALRRRIGRAQLGMRRFEIEQLAQQRVVLRVGDRRVVEDVVAVVRVFELRAQVP